jgi:CubicO group peptidase (beta-lactamase class C family)
MKTAFLIALFMMLAGTLDAQTDKLAAFRETFRKEIADTGIAGGSFVFISDGKTLAEEHVGLANIEKKQSANADTIYHWASNTKPFTGIAIMQLRDRGLMKLDDPVTKYLPELRDVHNKFGSMDGITIRHLMTHSAGFRGSTWPWDKGEPWEPFEPTEYSQLVAMFPFTEVMFKPGSKYSYSNPGIIFLGRIIEKLTGDDYEVYVDKNILKPLGMHRSYFDATPYHLLPHRSHSYYMREGKRTEGRFDVNTGITVSNSGLNSPIADMVKYLNFLTGSGDKAVHEGVLKRASLEEMWQPQLPAAADANGNAGFSTDIGLIYFLDRRDGRTFIGHGGDQNGFISYIDFEPVKRQGSIIVFNTDVAGGEVYTRLRRSLRAAF